MRTSSRKSTTDPVTDQVIDKAWSDVQPGNRVRWATARSIRYGVVLQRKGQSLVLDLLDEDRPKVIPDGRWYFLQAKLHGPSTEEHLVVIERFPDAGGEVMKVISPRDANTDVWITAAEAAEMLNWSEKQLRRQLRRGVIVANKRDGRWLVHRDRLRDAAAKHGWL